MKQFLAVYIGTPVSAAKAEWDKLNESTRQQREQAGMKAWGDWMVANQKSIVVAGGPLGKTKRASKQGIEDTKNALTGYIVVQAASLEAAAKMFQNHPHFTHFPGDSVEIVECLPMPG